MLKIKIDFPSFFQRGIKTLNDNFGIFLITGYQGSGKTWYSIYLMEKHNNATIYTNIHSYKSKRNKVVTFSNSVCTPLPFGTYVSLRQQYNWSGFQYQSSGSGILDIYPVGEDSVINWEELESNPSQFKTTNMFVVQCNNVRLSSNRFIQVYTANSDYSVANDYFYGVYNSIKYDLTPEQLIIDNMQQQTQATQDVNNSINDQSDANTSGFLEDVNQDYSNNPVSDLITMPITFLQRLNNNANGGCITWNLGSLLGTNLTMPCINLQQILGSTLYNLIDMAICLFLAYNLGLMCVTIWNNMTSLKDDFDDMYSPRHAYNGKHTGGGS